MAEPCAKCHIPGGSTNFHICVDLSYRAPGEGITSNKSDAHRKAISEGLKRSWERRRSGVVNGEQERRGGLGVIPNRTG